jgi:hypothetical protein
MWRKALTRLSETSWWPFPAPALNRETPEEFRARVARWKVKKLFVAQWTGGEWTEERTATVEHVKTWHVPLNRRIYRNRPQG